MHNLKFLMYWLVLQYRHASYDRKRTVGFRVEQTPEMILADFGMFNNLVPMVGRYRLLSLFDLRRVTKNNSYIQNVTLDKHWYNQGINVPVELLPYAQFIDAKGRKQLRSLSEWDGNYRSDNGKILSDNAEYMRREKEFISKDMKGLFSMYDYSQTRCAPALAESLGMLNMVKRGLPQDLIISVTKDAAALESLKPNTEEEARRLLILRSNLRLVNESKVRLNDGRTGFYSVPRGLQGIVQMLKKQQQPVRVSLRETKPGKIAIDRDLFPISAIIAEWGTPLLSLAKSRYPLIRDLGDYIDLFKRYLGDFEEHDQYACFYGLAWSHLFYNFNKEYRSLAKDRDIMRRINRLKNLPGGGFKLAVKQVASIHENQNLREKFKFAQEQMKNFSEYNILKDEVIKDVDKKKIAALVS